VSHRVVEEWMGHAIATLEDLLRPGLRVICVGINPAPTSVAAGHYYQGRLGQQFFARLRDGGLLPSSSGWEDDLAFAHGIGFTDIVKRPTARASEISSGEFEHGRVLLRAKIEAARPRLVIFTFKKTAETLFGPLVGNGLISECALGGSPIFVMPGPYARRSEVEQRLTELKSLASKEVLGEGRD
jgi:double-stranded uracil-DNA glycosylase